MVVRVPASFDASALDRLLEQRAAAIDAWLFGFGPIEPGRVQRPHDVIHVTIAADGTVYGREFSFGGSDDVVCEPFLMVKEHAPN